MNLDEFQAFVQKARQHRSVKVSSCKIDYCTFRYICGTARCPEGGQQTLDQFFFQDEKVGLEQQQIAHVWCERVVEIDAFTAIIEAR